GRGRGTSGGARCSRASRPSKNGGRGRTSTFRSGGAPALLGGGRARQRALPGRARRPGASARARRRERRPGVSGGSASAGAHSVVAGVVLDLGEPKDFEDRRDVIAEPAAPPPLEPVPAADGIAGR